MLEVERIQRGREALYLKGYMFYQEELAGWDWRSVRSPSIRVFLGVSSVFSRAFYYSVWPELSVRHRQTTWTLLAWMLQSLPTSDVHTFLQLHGPACPWISNASMQTWNAFINERIHWENKKTTELTLYCRLIDLVSVWSMQVSHFKAFISWYWWWKPTCHVGLYSWWYKCSFSKLTTDCSTCSNARLYFLSHHVHVTDG